MGFTSAEVSADISKLNKLIEDNGFYAVTLYDVLIDALEVIPSQQVINDVIDGRSTWMTYATDYFATVSDYWDNMNQGMSDRQLEEVEEANWTDLTEISELAHRLCNILAIGFTVNLDEVERSFIANLLMSTRDIFDPTVSMFYCDVIDDALVLKCIVPNAREDFEEEEHSIFDRITADIRRIMNNLNRPRLSRQY